MKHIQPRLGALALVSGHLGGRAAYQAPRGRWMWRTPHPPPSRRTEARAGIPAIRALASWAGCHGTSAELAGSGTHNGGAAAQLVRIASADAGAVAGTVRITASEIIGVEVLPPILSGLKALHPGLSFEIALTNSIDNVLRHDADIAVRMVRPHRTSAGAQGRSDSDRALRA